jgi:hypothetical protein
MCMLGSTLGSTSAYLDVDDPERKGCGGLGEGLCEEKEEEEGKKGDDWEVD